MAVRFYTCFRLFGSVNAKQFANVNLDDTETSDGDIKKGR